MTKQLRLPENVTLLRQHCGVHDDFRTFVTGGEFTSLVADSGSSCAAGDTENGVLAIATGGTDNNEALVKTTKKIFKFGQDKPHEFEVSLQYTEANTDDANIFAGFSSALAADMMVDNGAGPATSFSGVGFFCTDSPTGTKVWNIIASLGATQTTAALTASNSRDRQAHTPGGSSFQNLRISFDPKTSTKADIEFYIDDVLVYKITDFIFTSAVVMYAGAYVKAGGANSETLNVDFIKAYKVR